MSGHSKWSTIKHKKASTDEKRGKVFSRLVKNITVAVKTGGGNNPDTNAKLRVAVDMAKVANMPKTNIQRAITSASKDSSIMEMATYEGFGPGNFSVIIETATDNKNRTVQELRALFSRGEGTLASSGSVSYNFKQRGLLLIKKTNDTDDQTLSLIDLGVEELEETDEGIKAFVAPSTLFEVKTKVDKAGFKVLTAQLVQKPVSLKTIKGESGQKALEFLDQLDEHEDVLNVFSDVNII